MKKVLLKAVANFVLFFMAAMCAGLLSSCNVTRTITTSASSYTNGDTTTTIITKTIESYDATKKAPIK